MSGAAAGFAVVAIFSAAFGFGLGLLAGVIF